MMHRTALLRAAVKPAIFLVGFLLILLLIHQTVLPLLAYVIPALQPHFYDWAVYGLYPTQNYLSFPLKGPKASVRGWRPACGEGVVLLTPNGGSVSSPGPMMLDSKGGLLWMSTDFHTSANLKVQHYDGQDYLTFWAGEKAATSGKGSYYMLDSSYEVAHEVSAVGEGLFGDLHEFKITDSGTALITVYNTTTADLTGMGLGRGPDGWIVDNLFQEIDLKTGQLMFQWRASDHFDPIETYMTNPLGGHFSSIPFDYYHLNSVEKDSQGNYLISSRHFHSVTCVSPTGETLWILGGRDNQFTDLSDGKATNFKWQHDARWISESDGLLSLFDNEKAGALHVDAARSRALILQIDVQNRTVTLLHEYFSAEGILAASQGSVQVLPESGNVFVGWGSAAAYTEVSHDGTRLCETHLGASWFFSWERLKSYRMIKAPKWLGTPKDPPQMLLQGDSVYVSWNGATEVAFWALEAVRELEDNELEDVQGMKAAMKKANDDDDDDDDGNDYMAVDIIPKVGFEGSFKIAPPSTPGATFSRFRVAALDSNQEVLACSESIEYPHAVGSSSIWFLLLKLLFLAGFLAGVWHFIRHSRSAGFSLRSWTLDKGNAFLSPTQMGEDGMPVEWRSADRPTAYEMIRRTWAQSRPRRPAWG